MLSKEAVLFGIIMGAIGGNVASSIAASWNVDWKNGQRISYSGGLLRENSLLLSTYNPLTGNHTALAKVTISGERYLLARATDTQSLDEITTYLRQVCTVTDILEPTLDKGLSSMLSVKDSSCIKEGPV